MREEIRNVFNADPDAVANPSSEHNATSEQPSTLMKIPENETQFGNRKPAPFGMAGVAPAEEKVPLFLPSEANELRGHWDDVQAGFVDEPRKAVEEADALVSTAVKRLGEIFSEERKKLEGQWERGDVSTEDLRLALRKYRSFFTRLLTV